MPDNEIEIAVWQPSHAKNAITRAGDNANERNLVLRQDVIKIKSDSLAGNIKQFLSQIGEVFRSATQEFDGFSVETITINAEINAKGGLTLLGLGGELGSKGGISFTLKKK